MLHLLGLANVRSDSQNSKHLVIAAQSPKSAAIVRTLLQSHPPQPQLTSRAEEKPCCSRCAAKNLHCAYSFARRAGRHPANASIEREQPKKPSSTPTARGEFTQLLRNVSASESPMAYSPESDYYEGSYISDAVPAAVESHPAWDHQTYCLQDVSLGQPSVLPYADYHSQPLDHTTSWLTMNPQSLHTCSSMSESPLSTITSGSSPPPLSPRDSVQRGPNPAPFDHS